MSDLLQPPESFTTARLTLRKPRLQDTTTIFRNYAMDDEVVRFLSWRPHDSEADTAEFLRICLRRWEEGSECTYAIEVADGLDEAVGMIGIRPAGTGVESGYVLARSFWGHGIMTEALTCLVDWSLAQSSIWRAAAYCDVENVGSARVMEKAGMSREGTLRRFLVHPNISPNPRDCFVYAKVRD